MTQTKEEDQIPAQIRSIISGLITSDLRWFSSVYILLATILFSLTALREVGFVDLIPNEILSIIVKVALIPIIANRVRFLISGETNNLKPAIFVRSFLLGFGLIAATILPAIILGISHGDSILLFLAFCLLAINLGYVLRFCLFPLPFSSKELSLVEAMQVTRLLGKIPLVRKLGTLLAPLAVFLVLSAVVSSISPTGRLWFIIPLTEALSSLAWIVFIYSISGLTLAHASDSEWNAMQLGPYRVARLATISAQGSKWLTKQISPKFALMWIIIAIAIWVANTIRVITEPPPQKISIKETRIEDNIVVIDLEITDTQEDFRGFHPMLLSIASANRTSLSDKIPVFELLPTEGEKQPGKQNLRLKFSTSRFKEELRQVEDLYLWYAQVKIEKVNLKDAPIITK